MPTSLATLITEVNTITKIDWIPDRTKQAVKKATLKAHNLDFFPRDLYELSFVFSPAAYIYNLDYLTLVPRFRALKYIRKFDPVSLENGDFLQVIDPMQALDAYGITKTNVCYLSGTNIQIKSSDTTAYYTMGCYRQPDVTDTGFSSWLADQFQYAIATEAARWVFMAVGKDDEAGRMKIEADEEFRLMKASALLLEGY